jgi:hypothetical protein
MIAASFPEATLLPAGRLRLAVAFLVVLLAVVVGGTIAMPDLLLPMLIVGGIVLAPVAGLLAWMWHDAPRSGKGIEVRPEGVFVAGRLEIPRAHARQALVARSAQGIAVVLQRRLKAMTVILVPDEATGHRLVAALGLDPVTAMSSFLFDSAALRGRSQTAFHAYLALVPVALLPLFFSDLSPLAAVLFVAWYVSILLTSIPTKVTVGLDGVEISWLWRRRLVRFSEIRSCEVRDNGVRLVGREGKDYWLSAAWQTNHLPSRAGRGFTSLGFTSRRDYLEAVGARIREAAEASRQRRSGLATDRLERAARPVAAWVRELRGLLVDRAADFREGATLPEHLWSAVEDTQAPAEIRAAAAAALSPTLDPEGRQRLRVVAAVALTPGLRVAIEAAAAQDDQALVDAMSAVVQLEERAVVAREN